MIMMIVILLLIMIVVIVVIIYGKHRVPIGPGEATHVQKHEAATRQTPHIVPGRDQQREIWRYL